MDWTLLLIGLVFCTLIMLIFYSFAKTEYKNLIILVITLLSFDSFVSLIPGIRLFEDLGLYYNWQGKILSILWSVLFICFNPFLTKEESGFTWKINRSSWTSFFIICAAGIGVQLWSTSLEGGIESLEFDTETLFFQLTMPGFSEEFVFRGIILGLLNKIFVSRKKILGANVGWGVLIQAIIFGAGHAFYFDELSNLQFALAPAIITGAIGLVIGWLREKSGSIILPVIFHNFLNSICSFLALGYKIF